MNLLYNFRAVLWKHMLRRGRGVGVGSQDEVVFLIERYTSLAVAHQFKYNSIKQLTAGIIRDTPVLSKNINHSFLALGSSTTLLATWAFMCL